MTDASKTDVPAPAEGAGGATPAATAAAATTTTTTTTAPVGSGPMPVQKVPSSAGNVPTAKVPTHVVVVTETQPPVLSTTCDNLYVAGTFFSIFATALTYPGLWDSYAIYVSSTQAGFSPTAKSYVAFALLFLFFSSLETFTLIIGLTKPPSERISLHKKSLVLTVWNLVLLIIAIATVFPSVGLSPYYGVAPACLLCALVSLTITFSVQIAAVVIEDKNDPKEVATFQPIVFTKKIAQDLLIANAILSSINLGFATGSLLFLAAFESGDAFNEAFYAGAAFTVIYFLVTIIATITGVMAVIPSSVSTIVLLITSWGFSIISFSAAIIAWFCQIYAVVTINGADTASTTSSSVFVVGQQAMVLVGWVFALATLFIGIAAYCVLEERSGLRCANCCFEPVIQERHYHDTEKGHKGTEIIQV